MIYTSTCSACGGPTVATTVAQMNRCANCGAEQPLDTAMVAVDKAALELLREARSWCGKSGRPAVDDLLDAVDAVLRGVR